MKTSKISETIANCLQTGGKILVCGNGGSAAEASHFVGEMVGKFKMDRKPYRAISLNTDTSVMTAISNDFGYKYVFSRQVEALGDVADVLITLSTSGKSKNCLMAQKMAKTKGMIVFDIPRVGKDTPSIQEWQLKFLHNLAGRIERIMER